MDFRVGQGFDVHAFGEGDHVMLGGVRIPHEKSLVAHSDGDVALHALCDALLGAAGLGDIGVHFPPSDKRWANVASSELLTRVAELLRAGQWHTANVDLTIVCEQPRIGPYAEEMCSVIASCLEIENRSVSVKATTSERLGFCGRGEGIAALAVALIRQG